MPPREPWRLLIYPTTLPLQTTLEPTFVHLYARQAFFQEQFRPVGVEAVQGEETLKDGMGASEAGRSPSFGTLHKAFISGY